MSTEQESEKYKNLMRYHHFERKKSMKRRVGDPVKDVIIETAELANKELNDG